MDILYHNNNDYVNKIDLTLLPSVKPRPQGGASRKCSYDYTVGFDSTAGVRFRPPRLYAYRQAGKAGHPAGLPVKTFSIWEFPQSSIS